MFTAKCLGSCINLNLLIENIYKITFYRREGSNLGFDLMSLNIQRGRDHGIKKKRIELNLFQMN